MTSALVATDMDQTGRAQDFMEKILNGLITPADCQSIHAFDIALSLEHDLALISGETNNPGSQIIPMEPWNEFEAVSKTHYGIICSFTVLMLTELTNYFSRKCILNRILKFDKPEVAPNELKR